MEWQTSRAEQLTSEEFELFRSWIHEHYGIFLEESKSDSLRTSLQARSDARGTKDHRDYFRLVCRDEEEARQLISLVTINETSFFRYPGQFEVLGDMVLPEILARRVLAGRKGIRIWSAGCSTGEEPYTLAIMALSSRLRSAGHQAEILGTDVSNEALAKARRGVYPARSLASMPIGTVQRWFEPAEEGFRPIQQVRATCSFAYHNLVKVDAPSPFDMPWDVIFCRNVTIYFQPESTKRVLDRFFEALNPGGYLFVGHSETLAAVTGRFEAVEFDGVFAYRKPPDTRVCTQELPAGSRTRKLRRATGDRLDQAARPASQESGGAEAPVSADRLAHAHGLLDRARAEEALGIADELLSQDPGSLEAGLLAAYAHADLGNTEEAAAHAKATLVLDPLAPAARYVLGVIKREQGDLDGALAEFRRTLYADRDFALAHFAVASIQRQRGNLDEAAREYGKTLRVLNASVDGSWTAFLGGFSPDLLARTCELGLAECTNARVTG